MAITRYQPTTDIFNPLFQSIFNPTLGGMSRMGSMLRAPEADVIERENDIRVEIEMPGLRPEDVEVSLEGNVLTISGEKQEERNEGEEGSTWHLSERRYGRFSRSFVLPRDVEQEQIEARFENGVLSVMIPKSERARRRRIEIRGGNGNGHTKQVEAGTAKQRK
ncbi:MAG: Hsp20/alpha crystallin family protein [Gemmatimonadota bacterium]|nr:Hsp20/alpha crystallin family protein [Gemmatimonadota bacterium]